MMDRQRKFQVLVQTGLLANGPLAWDFAVRLMGLAMNIPEHHLPDDVTKAAVDFVRWGASGLSAASEPGWHREFVAEIYRYNGAQVNRGSNNGSE